jgi:hypothetical protein
MNCRFAREFTFAVLTTILAACGGDGEPVQPANPPNSAGSSGNPPTSDPSIKNTGPIALPAAVSASSVSGNP